MRGPPLIILFARMNDTLKKVQDMHLLLSMNMKLFKIVDRP
ncbi:hypothetical protein B4123_4265 [Bacillus paralicheniformis]|nr:hypothetical protein B4123_4265 [Bacillus paralicheniformis]TWJ53774.1 hypothetical protein CHCC5023_2904 [Bacillus paralicheniformis]TWJ73770.1 hypothetical protein CHCC5019_1016 [Bacillus paralicheniformis]TWN99341.1 hypothetical protein CHCC20490_2585 [Bacillus paralicheniformis]